MRYDLAVIGSGAAGFAAAIAARRKGRGVVMIERGEIGGTCVNTGCIPSKALLAAADARGVNLADRFPGITGSPASVHFGRLLGGTHELVEAMRAAKYVDLAAEYGWDIVAGTARFDTAGSEPVLHVAHVDRGSRVVRAEHYLVATGSAPHVPAVEGLAEAGYLTSTSVLELAALPRSMVVLGGGAVGLEQAQLWSELGVDVTLVEALPRLAPLEEAEIGTAVAAMFDDAGIEVATGATLDRIDKDATGYHVSLRGADGRAHRRTAEQVLVATGRRPVTTQLNLEAVGVGVSATGAVVVDEYLRTAHPRIWAAGDVTGHPQFVYVAAAHGGVVADNAFDDSPRPVDYRHLPRVTFTSPAIGAVGLTEGQATEQGFRTDSRVLSLEHLPRAMVSRDTRGLIKLVADRDTGRVLGVHALADGAGEVIAAAGYALAGGLTVAQLAEAWSPYLTMAESLKLAAQAFTRDVTALSCCAA